jgi:hypothetical protein
VAVITTAAYGIVNVRPIASIAAPMPSRSSSNCAGENWLASPPVDT